MSTRINAPIRRAAYVNNFEVTFWGQEERLVGTWEGDLDPDEYDGEYRSRGGTYAEAMYDLIAAMAGRGLTLNKGTANDLILIAREKDLADGPNKAAGYVYLGVLVGVMH